MRTKRQDKNYQYIGLDVSINRPGFCFGRNKNDCFICGHIDHSKNKHIFPNRILKFNTRIDELIAKIEISIIQPKNVFIMIEDYAPGAKGRTNEIAELTGILKHKLIYDHNVRPSHIFLCGIQHLKMFSGLPGNAKKEFVIKQVLKKWDFDTDVDDEADAFIMWQLIRELVEPGSTQTTKQQQEIIKKVKDYNAKNNT